MGTANDVLDMLRRNYLPDGRRPAGIFAPEIEAPGGGRRADLIWQGLTASGGRELVGHEVKVSRADLLAELADPTKSHAWQRFCDRWWLVVTSPSIVAGLDLPATWGVLTPPSGRRTRTMTLHVPAPPLHPDDQTPALRTLAAWLHWRHHRAAEKLTAVEDSLQRAYREIDRLRRQAPAVPERTTPTQDMVERIVRDLGGVGYAGAHLGEAGLRLDPADVVAALKDLGAVQARAEQARQQLDGNRARLTRMAEAITHTLADDPDLVAP